MLIMSPISSSSSSLTLESPVIIIIPPNLWVLFPDEFMLFMLQLNSEVPPDWNFKMQ